MDAGIHDIDEATGLSRGRFVVDAADNLLTLPLLSPLKPSMRWATVEDIAAARARAADDDGELIEVDDPEAPPVAE